MILDVHAVDHGFLSLQILKATHEELLILRLDPPGKVPQLTLLCPTVPASRLTTVPPITLYWNTYSSTHTNTTSQRHHTSDSPPTNWVESPPNSNAHSDYKPTQRLQLSTQSPIPVVVGRNRLTLPYPGGHHIRPSAGISYPDPSRVVRTFRHGKG